MWGRRTVLPVAALFLFCASMVTGCSAVEPSITGGLISDQLPSTVCYPNYSGPITFGLGTIQNTSSQTATVNSVTADAAGPLKVLGANVMSVRPGLDDPGHPSIGTAAGYPPVLDDPGLTVLWKQSIPALGAKLTANTSADLVVGVQRTGTPTTDSQIAGLTVAYTIGNQHFDTKIPSTLVVKARGNCG